MGMRILPFVPRPLEWRTLGLSLKGLASGWGRWVPEGSQEEAAVGSGKPQLARLPRHVLRAPEILGLERNLPGIPYVSWGREPEPSGREATRSFWLAASS